MNKVVLVGRLGQEVKIRKTTSGKSVARLRVATREYNEETEWHDIVAWGKLAETCFSYLGKGDRVCVLGRLSTNSWKEESPDHGEVIRSERIVNAETIEFLTTKKSNQEQPDNPQETNL